MSGIEQIDCRPFGVVARLGTGSPAILVQSYTVSQHHQLMDEPYEPRVADGRIWGRGVSQSKGHQAVMLAVLRALSTGRSTCTGHLSGLSTTRPVAAIGAPMRSSRGCLSRRVSASCRRQPVCR